MDKENKATVIRLWSFAFPHMTAFHLAWVAFFISFCSTFMAAPLMPVIREDLGLTATQVGNANSASVAGTVFFRIAMGSLCDSVGPRKAYGLLMILVSFPCFAMTMVTNYAAFVTCRCAIGFSLASFVSTQYWTTQVRLSLRILRCLPPARSRARYPFCFSADVHSQDRRRRQRHHCRLGQPRGRHHAGGDHHYV